MPSPFDPPRKHHMSEQEKERLLFGSVICHPCDGVGHTYAPRGTVTGEAPPGYGDNYLKCRSCKGTGFEAT